MEATVLSVGKSVVNGALSYAKSAVAEEVALQLGVQRDQAFITDELEMIQGFLMAAHKEKDDDNVVKIWVKQVRDVAYDVEDCLQDFAVRVDKSFWWCIPSTLLDRRSVAMEMKELRAKVEDVSQRSARYRLIRSSFPKPTGTAEQSTISTEVQLQIAEAAGTTLKECNKVDLSKLITDDENDHRVIAVLGANNDFGVTSIIRYVYNDQDVKDMFECRAWVKLMHPFNPNDFFMGMVRQFYEDLCEGTEKEAKRTATGVKILKQMASQDNLVDEFNRYVTEKRYLVVITDVSTIEEWDWIKTYFPSKKRSRIILSTQKFEVASLCIEHGYTVSEIEQQWSSDKEFFVFYKQVDTKEEGKPSIGTTADIASASSIEPVASASHDDQLIDRGKAKGEELGERFQRRAWLTMSRSFEDQEFLGELIRQLSREERGNADKLRTDSVDIGALVELKK
ncbi:disease resistance protein RPP13-like [Lolium perenne]|uniref:disease resistance protein RPP13-like n=1 Tax=Lolium perenne TaxID=4522 RepID=UPI0021F69332|nr:disease resistance protein RPP13-like [Lolium perenne]